MNHTKFHCPRQKTLVFLAVYLSNYTKSEKIGFCLLSMQFKFPLAKPYPESKKGLPLSSGRPRVLSRKSGPIFKWLRPTWWGLLLLTGTIQRIAAQIRRQEVERGPRSLKSLIEFMPRRLEEDIDREGWKHIIINKLLFSCLFAEFFFLTAQFHMRWL
jgi:hypothetical protein